MKKINIYFMIIMVAVMSAGLISCEKDEDTAGTRLRFKGEVNELEVTFFVNIEDNANTYAWDFGDGTTSTEMEPIHLYEKSGEVIVTLTVTGSGSTEKSVQLVEPLPSPQELLAGPADNPDGITWVVSRTYYDGKDGNGPITPELMITFPYLVDNVIEDYVGLGAEYDNEFTFKPDGSYSVNNVNGSVLAGELYAFVSQTGTAAGGFGFAAAAHSPATDATWSLERKDVTVTVASVDPATDPGTWAPVPGPVTFSNVLHIETIGDYFGLLDLTNTVIIKDINTEVMHIAILFHAIPVPEIMMLPAFVIHLTLEKKQ
jgi:hypothetical protein